MNHPFVIPSLNEEHSRVFRNLTLKSLCNDGEIFVLIEKFIRFTVLQFYSFTVLHNGLIAVTEKVLDLQE